MKTLLINYYKQSHFRFIGSGIHSLCFWHAEDIVSIDNLQSGHTFNGEYCQIPKAVTKRYQEETPR